MANCACATDRRYVWAVHLRLVGEGVTKELAADLQERLHRYNTRVRLEELVLRMRVVGHEGPASAVGDASQAARFEAARAGIRGGRIDVVYARSISATRA